MNRGVDGRKPSHESSSSAEEIGQTPRGRQHLAGARDSLRGFVDQKRLAQVKEAELKTFCAAVASDLDIKNMSGFLSDAQKKLIADLFVKFFPSSSHSAPRVPRLRLPGQESAPTLPPATRTPRALVSARGLRASESTGSPRGLVRGQAAAIKQLKKGLLAGETDERIDAFLTFARTCGVDLGDKQAVARLYQTWRARFDTGGAYIKGQTELMEAIERGDGKQVLNLLEHGVDPGVSQNWALNGKVIAEDYLDPNSKNYLVAGGLLDWVTRLVPTDQKGWGVGLSAVTLAVVVDSNEPLAALARWIGANRLKRKHILGVGDSGGMTAVTRCVGEIGKREGQQRLNRLERLQLLLSLGAKINQPDGNGDTALTMAVKFHDRPLIRELLKAGAKICCYPSPIVAAFACEPPDYEVAVELIGEAGQEIKRLMCGPTGKCADALASLLSFYGRNAQSDKALLDLLADFAEDAPPSEVRSLCWKSGWLELPADERLKFEAIFAAHESKKAGKAEWLVLQAVVELRDLCASLEGKPPTPSDWGKIENAIARLPDLWAILAARGLTPDMMSNLSDMLQSMSGLWKLALGGDVKATDDYGYVEIIPSPFPNPMARKLMECCRAVWRQAFEKSSEEDRNKLLAAAKEAGLKEALTFAALEGYLNVMRKAWKFSANSQLRNMQTPVFRLQTRRVAAKAFLTLAPLYLAIDNNGLADIWERSMSTKERAAYRKSIGVDSVAMKRFLDELES